MYEVDSIPFFKYFTKLNINRAAVVPNSTAIYGQSPIIDYTDLDNIVEDEILSFYDKLLRQKLSIPESVNWEMDYTIYRPQNEAAVQLPELYQTEIDDSIARPSQLSAAKSQVELDQNDPLTDVLDPALNQQKFSISGLNWRPSDGNLNI